MSLHLILVLYVNMLLTSPQKTRYIPSNPAPPHPFQRPAHSRRVDIRCLQHATLHIQLIQNRKPRYSTLVEEHENCQYPEGCRACNRKSGA